MTQLLRLRAADREPRAVAQLGDIISGQLPAKCGDLIEIDAWLVALPLSVPIGDAFGRIMFEVPRVWLPTAGGGAAWLGLVIIVALCASAWPALRAMRVPPARALSYE